MNNDPQKNRLATALDHFEPPHGPCAFCGHEDARHRIWDTWIERARFESAEVIADDYEVPLAYVQAVLALEPYQ